MIASFFLSLREMLEAALIVGIVLGALRTVHRSDLNRLVWLGVALAAFISLMLGLVLNLLRISLEGIAETLFEGITMILAAGILTWVLFWMRGEGKALRGTLEGGAIRTAMGGSGLALFLLALTAVLREGIELAIFLTAASIEAAPFWTVLGAVLGLLAALGLGWLVFSSSIRLHPRGFFTASTVILTLFAAGLLAHGVHELNEAGILPEITAHIWDTSALLPEDSTLGQLLTALFGYNADPSLMEVTAYGAYFLIVLLSLRITTRFSNAASDPPPANPGL